MKITRFIRALFAPVEKPAWVEVGAAWEMVEEFPTGYKRWRYMIKELDARTGNTRTRPCSQLGHAVEAIKKNCPVSTPIR